MSLQQQDTHSGSTATSNPVRTPNNQLPKLGLLETAAFFVLLVTLAIVGTVGLDHGKINRFHLSLLLVWFLTSTFLLKYGKLTTLRPYVETGVSVNSQFLSTKQKVLLWACSLISPPVAGITTSLLWHRTDYLKARQANAIALITFLIELIGILLGAFIL